MKLPEIKRLETMSRSEHQILRVWPLLMCAFYAVCVILMLLDRRWDTAFLAGAFGLYLWVLRDSIFQAWRRREIETLVQDVMRRNPMSDVGIVTVGEFPDGVLCLKCDEPIEYGEAFALVPGDNPEIDELQCAFCAVMAD